MRPGKKYTHVFFDLDNTLWDFQTNSFDALHLVFKQMSVFNQNVDFHLFFEVYSRHNKRLWEEYRKKNIVKKELTTLRFQETLDELDIRGMNPALINERYLAAMPFQNKLIDGAVSLLDYLKSRGYLLFVITNGFREVQNQKLKESAMKSYFTKVFISEEIKAPKPSRQIFEYALKSANAPKKSSIMVGDDYDVDVAGALQFGMDAILFDAHNQTRNHLEVTPQIRNAFYRVRHLSEIKEIL